MKKKSTRRVFGTLVALIIMLAGGALIYSGWQSKPGREEFLALGIGMTIGGLVLDDAPLRDQNGRQGRQALD